MSSELSFSERAQVIFPRYDVLSAELENQPEQSKVSKAFSVAFPKLHALAITNYEAAKEANLAINTRVLNEVAFNDLIDYLIKELDSNGDTARIADLAHDYMHKNNLLLAIRSDFFSIRLTGDDDRQLPKEQLKTNLLTAKINAQSFPGGVVGLTNVADSLARTALQSKKVERTNLGTKLDALRKERDLKIASAYRECRKDFDLLAELEKLLRNLSNIDDRTPLGDIDDYFHHFVAITGVLKELYGTGHELDASVEDLLDQLDGSPESRIKFYKDLLKPESDYLQILLRSVVKAREEVIEKADLLNLAHREVRTEGFDKFDLRYDPRTGIIFKDVFNKINNFTCEWALVSKPISWFKESLIDRSKSSCLATAGIVTGVCLYVIYKMAQAVVSFGLALICYLGGSAAWGIGKSGRYILVQGFDRVKDHFEKTNIPNNNNLELQAEIANSDRPTNLLTRLRLTDFYQAYEAKLKLEAAVKMQALGRGYIARKDLKAAKEAKAAFEAKKEAATRLQAVFKRAPMRAEYQKQEAARLAAEDERAEIIAAGIRADEFFAAQEQHFAARAQRDAFQANFESSGDLLRSVQVAKTANLHQNLFRSARVDGQRFLMGSARVNGQRSLFPHAEM